MDLIEYYLVYFGLTAAGLALIYYVFIHRFARRVEREEAARSARHPSPAE